MISEAFENFQLKTYGIKAQVHATPEKKKRNIYYFGFLCANHNTVFSSYSNSYIYSYRCICGCFIDSYSSSNNGSFHDLHESQGATHSF
ncbi:hypothetical protein OROGR_011716 [Orobanche gracilis]